MCSGSLIYLLDLGEVTEEVTGEFACQLPTSFWTFITSQVWKESGGEQFNKPLP